MTSATLIVAKDTDISDLRAADLRHGAWESTPVAKRRLHTTKFPNSPTVCTNRVVGRMATIWKIGCVQNSNSFTTTSNCERRRYNPTES